MKITGQMLTDLAKIFVSPERQARRKLFYQMHQMYEGGGRSIIEAKIKQEFSDPKAVEELNGRLVTINFMKKIIDKSAGVYAEAPVRAVVDENEDDEELLELYEDGLRVNMIQKESNRHIKMYKRCLKKFYVDNKGRPRALVKPAHSYEVFNLGNQDPVCPDVVAELIKDAVKPEDMEIHWYSDESFWITDGTGAVKIQSMESLLNAGVNEIGALPFEYRVTSSTDINPPVEDDLLHLCITLPIVITDLFFALKYQCWSIIYTINATAGGKQINLNPSSVVELTGDPGQTPSIGQIKPQVDTDKVISLIEFVVNMMLSAKGLSTGTLNGRTSARDVVSGVSKMLDSADIIEDKKDQQDLFLVDETDIWEKLALYMIPYWRVRRMLNTRFDREFSPSFLVAIIFKDPKAMISQTERVDIAVKELGAALTTRKKYLQEKYPDWTENMIDDFIKEIDEEKAMSMPSMDEGGSSGSAFQVGEKVKIKKGMEHDPSHAGMTFTVADVKNGTYALKMPDGNIHKWYKAEELQASSGGKEKAKKDDGMKM